MITQQELKELLHYDPNTGVFTWKVNKSRRSKIGMIAGWKNKLGYWCIEIDGIAYKQHRLAWLYVNGKMPDHTIDHINHNPSDNRISNLRDVPFKVNNWNRRPKKGYHWNANYQQWRVQIRYDGKQITVGMFDTEEEAFNAYVEAKKKYHQIP